MEKLRQGVNWIVIAEETDLCAEQLETIKKRWAGDPRTRRVTKGLIKDATAGVRTSGGGQPQKSFRR
jgi:hypothetical protein